MRDLDFFSSTPLAGLDNQRIPFSPSGNREGLFNAAKFYAVTLMFWTGLIAGCAISWYGVFCLSVKIGLWMGH